MIKCSVDGSCKPNPGFGGCGYVILVDDIVKYSGGVFIGQATNNIAELKAIEIALEILKENGLQNEIIDLETDSNYAVGLFMKNWNAKVNTELVEKIRNDLKLFPNLNLTWVKGHANNKFNLMADKLAQQVVDHNVTKR